jgi:hypothetical protein
MTVSIMALSITTLGIKKVTLGITTLNIMRLSMTLSIAIKMLYTAIKNVNSA